MLTHFLRFCWLSILSLSILQTATAVEQTPTKSKSGGGGTATPTASPEKKAPPPGAIDEKLFGEMKWRQVGPFRGGRALPIEGVPGQPDTWYFGAVAAGVSRPNHRRHHYPPPFHNPHLSPPHPPS